MGLKIDRKEPITALPRLGKGTQYEEKFKRLLLDHQEWIQKADHLCEAASLFREKIRETWTDWLSRGKPGVSDHFIRIYFMLASYALENLFKALIVLRRRIDLERKLQENPNKMPHQICGHDLLEFAKQSKFVPINAADEEFLRKLSRSATWYGRYPIPTKPVGFEDTYTSEDKNEIIYLGSYATTDGDQFEK